MNESDAQIACMCVILVLYCCPLYFVYLLSPSRQSDPLDQYADTTDIRVNESKIELKVLYANIDPLV